ncbi:MAG: Holliday junction DNA helicase RuvA [Candidatus Omnitrophica bacterium]|nr:Holliday junction DNA helicase RuvA [Candidatus Omnitrophota bacterium]
MIARITGKITEKGTNYVLIDTGGITYEVLLPVTVMQRLDEEIVAESSVSFIIYHYLQVEPSRSIPVLIGFLNEIEKEFFSAFITVSGIGPRAALKALNQPISLIAQAIDEANIEFLKSLPGIGEQRAKEIVAKLQNKVGKFALIQDNKVVFKDPAQKDTEEEVLAVLVQLGYKKQEALIMIKKAIEGNKGLQNSEQLLNEVYRQKKVS